MRRITWIVLLLLVVGCGGTFSSETTEEERTAVRQTLERYLPLLARTYATSDTTPLESYAAQREVATVQKRLSELGARGERLEPEFQGLSLESVNLASHTSAYATTLEVWDLRLYSTSGGDPVVEAIGQRNRVKYQLKREEGRWIILYRELEQTFD